MLNCYAVFHLNLMYSSIEKKQRKEVIEKCYYPLLKLAEDGVPLGVELTGLTLEIISELDKDWIEEFKCLIAENRIELIGSGYAQIIGPLLPKKMNEMNQRLGIDAYEAILGIKPEVALVNEMAYSAGMIGIYADSSYKAVVMEWNNPHRFHKEQADNLKYHPQYAKGVGCKLPVIWADSIAFQKFQRYVHSEITLKEYLGYLKSESSRENSYFPIYANDAEIFNFRPGRYKAEGLVEHDEWKRIKRLFHILKNWDDFRLLLPIDTLSGLQENELVLESPQQPIPVKKQEKYNINRWALTGRDDLKINTEIYRIYKALLNGNPDKNDWKKLCYLASSDFRTHITQKRWEKYINELYNFSKKWHLDKKRDPYHNSKKKTFKIKESKFVLDIETENMRCIFDKFKGLSIKELYFKNKSNKPLIGTLPHGYYEDISLGADFFSCHSIIEKSGQHKYTNLSKTEPKLKIMDNFIIISEEQKDRDITFKKNYFLFTDRAKLNIKIDINMTKRELAIIHPLNITFVPEAFDRKSLFYCTNNGGDLEKFYMQDASINHSQSLSTLISAKYGLGATEGVLIVGDKYKSIRITHDQSISAMIPSIYYLPIDDNFFIRLQYSAQEIDDTFKENNNPVTINCLFSIE